MIRSIVVGTDGSVTAERAVQEARDLARAMGARICLVTVYASTATTTDQPPGGRQGADDILREAAASLERDGLDVTTYAREGDAAEAIVDVAEEIHADLIVVGNRGMTGAQRFLLGSVPNQISHQAPCSVLIVRTN